MVPRTPEGEDPDVVEQLDPSDCGKLVGHSIKCANERVKAVPGISGEVDGQLTVDPTYQRVDVAPTAVPIDTLVNTALEGVNAQAEEVEVDVEAGGDNGPINLTDDLEEFSLDGLAGDLDVDVEDVFSDEDDE